MTDEREPGIKTLTLESQSEESWALPAGDSCLVALAGVEHLCLGCPALQRFDHVAFWPMASAQRLHGWTESACRVALQPGSTGTVRSTKSTYALRSYVVRSTMSDMRTLPNVLDSGPPLSRRRSNDPPILILMSLAGGAKHGHALLKDIEEFAGVKLGPGALYGAITRLEERGLIEPLESDDRRRPYRITATGSKSLADSLAQMRELVRVGQARLKMASTRRPRLA